MCAKVDEKNGLCGKRTRDERDMRHNSSHFYGVDNSFIRENFPTYADCSMLIWFY